MRIRWMLLLLTPLLVVPIGRMSATQPASPIPVGQAANVAPGQTVVFAHPSMRAPGATLTIPVTNQGDQAAAVVNDGMVFMLTLSAGSTIRAETAYEGPNARVVACATEPGAPYIARCPIVEERATQVSIRFMSTTMAPPTEAMRLVTGCNNVSLTWPDGTSPALVARAISPDRALDAIWRYDAVGGRFIAWSPLPGAPNDLLVVQRLDAVFLCMRAPGTLTRPTI